MTLLVLFSLLIATQSVQTGTEKEVAGSVVRAPSRGSDWARWIDLEGDGRLEALLVTPEGGLRFLWNRGNGGFEDVTSEVGLGGVEKASFGLWHDFDGDDHVDLLVGTSGGPTRLFRNTGGDTFEEVTATCGLESRGEDLAASWLDFDGDGLSDLHLVTAREHHLYRALGEGLLERVELQRFEGGVEVPSPGPPGEAGAIEGNEPETGPGVLENLGLPGLRARSSGRYSFVVRSGLGALPPSPHLPITTTPGCLDSIGDQVGGACLLASSTPTLGMLYPLSNELYVDASTGNVGVGTTTPQGALSVVGPNPPPNTSHASFGESMWRMRRHVGDEVSAGTIDYRGFDPDALSIVGAGIDNGGLPNERHVRVYDRMGVNADPMDGLSLLVSGMGASYSAAFVGGHVGIGTATPSETLDISGGEIRLADQFTGETLHMSVKGPAADVFSRDQPLFINNAGSNQELYLMGSRVGIGTSTPSNLLSVEGVGTSAGGVPGFDEVVARFHQTTAPNNTAVSIDSLPGEDAVLFLASDGRSVWNLRNDASSADQFQIRDSTGDRLLRIDTNGEVSVKVLKILGGADLVEGFDTGDYSCEPGTVLVIDPTSPRRLVPSTAAYDSKVAGVVSGAGGVEHGIQMGQNSALDGDTLVAMTGRVYVKCSAENGPVKPGDLLTTASMHGHAMKATDSSRSFGAVLGKAMTGLESGKGLVLTLVNLQ